jgi:hypothetical protein
MREEMPMSEAPKNTVELVLAKPDGSTLTVPAAAVSQKDGYLEINTDLVPSLRFTQKDGYVEVEEIRPGDKP